MIVRNFHVVSVAVSEFETNPPGAIDRHRPLTLPGAFEPVKPDALERAQLVDGRSRIEHFQDFKGPLTVKTGKTTRYSLFVNLAGFGVLPCLDHGVRL